MKNHISSLLCIRAESGPCSVGLHILSFLRLNLTFSFSLGGSRSVNPLSPPVPRVFYLPLNVHFTVAAR